MPTAIEIFKHLPKKNCAECKHPTCLAFAMALANNKAKLEDCPYVSEAGKAALSASSAPPMRLVKLGAGRRMVEVGDETELYRHEKKFFHPTRYCLELHDGMSAAEIDAFLDDFRRFRFERVGQMMELDMIGIVNKGSGEDFAKAAAYLGESVDHPIVLFSASPENMALAAKALAGKAPLLHAATSANLEAMCKVGKENKCPLVLQEKDLNALAGMAEKARALGVEDLVLDFDASGLKELLEKSSILRKVAVKKLFRGLGYPIFVRAGAGRDAVLRAEVATMKYGSVVSFSQLKGEEAYALFVLRQNIYTDPQVPIQVRPELYTIGVPGPNAPVLFTTNFSLTYFTVAADIEKSKVPCYLLVVDTEGLSVLTAFAAGKLSSEGVQKALDKVKAKEKTTGPLIIPGMVARMAPKLGELTGMKVLVGPKESSGLPKFLRQL
jgi:acetyl-CoA decarbonylase/synthase complex subunit gamma